MNEEELTIGQVLQLLPEACEILVDAAIAAEPCAETRAVMRVGRDLMISKCVEAATTRNLQARRGEMH